MKSVEVRTKNNLPLVETFRLLPLSIPVFFVFLPPEDLTVAVRKNKLLHLLTFVSQQPQTKPSQSPQYLLSISLLRPLESTRSSPFLQWPGLNSILKLDLLGVQMYSPAFIPLLRPLTH